MLHHLPARRLRHFLGHVLLSYKPHPARRVLLMPGAAINIRKQQEITLRHGVPEGSSLLLQISVLHHERVLCLVRAQPTLRLLRRAAGRAPRRQQLLVLRGARSTHSRSVLGRGSNSRQLVVPHILRTIRFQFTSPPRIMMSLILHSVI